MQHAHGALHLPRRRSLGRTATRCTRRPLPTGRAECVIPIPLPLEWRSWIPEPLAAKIVKIDVDVLSEVLIAAVITRDKCYIYK